MCMNKIAHSGWPADISESVQIHCIAVSLKKDSCGNGHHLLILLYFMSPGLSSFLYRYDFLDSL